MDTSPAPAERLRVLIADDHPMFRSGLRALLASVPDIEVVAESASGEQAIADAIALQPDLVLMDLQMPGIGGVEATRQILDASPAMRVLIITMFEDDFSVFTAMRAGARGYILKGASPDEMLRAIRVVGSGEAIFSAAIAVRLIDFFAVPKPSVPPRAFPELSDREREILDLIAQGANNTEIANRLVLSPKTVRNHVSNIFSKLQVADRAQAIIRGRQAGLG
jgi:DNA-binding NarL/FixJ family response regulator